MVFHGFRKYFETHAMESMKLLNVKILMGHDTGLEKSYYKPTEKDILEDYLKVVDLLTISEVNKLKLEFEENKKLVETSAKQSSTHVQTPEAEITEAVGFFRKPVRDQKGKTASY